MTTKALRFRYIQHYTQIRFKLLTSSTTENEKKEKNNFDHSKISE